MPSRQMPLINFIVQASDQEINEISRIASVDNYISEQGRLAHALVSRGDFCWCALTFLHLRNAGSLFSLRLSNTIDPKAINFIHSPHLQQYGDVGESYVVCIKADFPRQLHANFHIVQNDLETGRRATRIYLWPQPGLIPRKTGKVSERLTFAYIGQTQNGNLAYGLEFWNSIAERTNTRFLLKNSDWHDFSEIDVAVAIRSFSNNTYKHKPPSKLINAWLAGTPFIGGNDSAYSQIGKSENNYLKATSQGLLETHLKRLATDGDFFQTMVERGRASVKNYTVPSLASCWIQVISSEILPHADWWFSRSNAYRNAVRKTSYLGNRVIAKVKQTAHATLRN